MKHQLFGSLLKISIFVAVLSASLTAQCHAQTSFSSASSSLSPIAVPLAAETAKPVALPFVVTARATKATFQAGETVELEIEVQNESDKAANLTFPSGQSFDFSATRKGEKEPLWKWSMDKMFTQIVRSETLAAGKSLKFTAQWAGAPAGFYIVKGKIMANGGLDAPPFRVEVVNEAVN